MKTNYEIKRSAEEKAKLETEAKDVKNSKANVAAAVESKTELTAEACRQMRVCARRAQAAMVSTNNVGDYTPSNRSGHGAELWGGQIVLTGGYDNSEKGAIDRNSRLVKTNAERFVVV